MAKVVAASFLLAVLAACHVPVDPEKTEKRVIARGELIVGVTEAEPWIRRASPAPDSPAAGIEAELINELARQMGVAVRWHWGSTEEHFAALEKYELDLVAAGLTDDTPWKNRIGMTRPWVKSALVVGFPPSRRPSDSLDDLEVAVEPSNELAAHLEDAGARPVSADDPYATGLPVAAPAWELRARGYAIREDPLVEERHIMAVPPGENGWLVRVERHLLPQSARTMKMLEEASRP